MVRKPAWHFLVAFLPVIAVTAFSIVSQIGQYQRAVPAHHLNSIVAAAFCITAAFGVFWVVATIWLRKRRLRALAQSLHFELCTECGYSLRGLPDPHQCPECGVGYTKDDARQRWQTWLAI